ncbi:Gamma-tubulin complex component 3 [Hondaea fermentalgiana]|uniref:Gamma-tubulin complex component 3 n=1 Tax=Hondaea fermentalgiana TaxID=2315210 RepID=A0A2R5GF00_9STRA|nr:Gamma-tubulin complex component 3 [Hondaea fermentalgiana]|eukprot:GBG29500.1 Gamma-tubulin complex component 3 [Hondaea fermentalgiana]
MAEGVRVAALLGELVERVVPAAKEDAATREELLRYAARLAGSRLGRNSRGRGKEQESPNDDGQGAAARLHDEVLRVVRRLDIARRDPAVAEQCDELILMLLRKQSALQRPDCIVKLLCDLSGTGAAQGSADGLVTALAPLLQKGASGSSDASAIESLVKPSGRWIEPPTNSRAADAAENTTTTMTTTANRAKARDTEALLVRDVLFVFQGIDGHLIKFSPENDAYSLSPLVTLPKAQRKLAQKLCELGWLFRRISGYVNQTLHVDSLGLVSQSFSSALQSELTEYFRLIAILEAQLPSPSTRSGRTDADVGSSSSVSETSRAAGLTLRQLFVWSQEPMRRLRLMAEMADSARGLYGGALASSIHMYSMHGDPFVSTFVDSIMQKVSAPIFESIRLWVVHGELADACGEFFVSDDLDVANDRLWFDKYKMNATMIPGFIGRSLARKILLIGKSINFIRVCCRGSLEDHHDAATEVGADFARLATSEDADGEDGASQSQARQNGVPVRPAQGALGSAEDSMTDRRTLALLRTVDRAAAATNKRLRTILFDQFHLLRHCRALKQYLMLGQGDTIQYLMDLLGPQLELPASQVFRHALVSQLETAVRATNANLDSDDVLERLDVRLMEASPGDSGWDVFVLDYHLDMPLNCVITADAMGRYYEIFTFLWRLKRVEYSLASAWKMEMTTEHVVRELHGVRATLHKFHVLRNEMVHFTSNLHSYIMFEVLETSWDTLVKDLDAAVDLDQVVQAHDLYLASILDKALIGLPSSDDQAAAADASPFPHAGAESDAGDASPASPQAQADGNALRHGMQTLFDLILRFCSVQRRLYNVVMDQVHRLKRTHFHMVERTRNAKWAIDKDSAEAAKAAMERDAFVDPAEIEDAQRKLAQEYDANVRVLAREYRESLMAFLECLKPAASENLKFLRFRLDFNQFYESS